MAWIDDLFSGSKANGANSNAREGVSQSQHAYDGMTAPTLTGITPTAQTSAAGMDPDAQKAQRASLAALQSLAANGGANAASTAQQAQIASQEGQQAQAQRNSVMQNAAARGMGNANTALLGQLSGNQAAANTAAMQGAQLAGNNANTAVAAGQGAAKIGAGLQGQQLAAAHAKDTMARFNSGQDLAAQHYNSQLPQQQFADSMGIAAGKAGGGRDSANYWADNANQAQRTSGSQLGGLLGVAGSAGNMAMAPSGDMNGESRAGGAYTSAFGTGQETSMVSPEELAAFGAMAEGGLVPGKERVPGDSLLNDVMSYRGPRGPVNLSAGEVVVPKSMRANGSDGDIASFVRHPPQTKQPSPTDKDKAAQLAALGSLAGTGAAQPAPAVKLPTDVQGHIDAMHAALRRLASKGTRSS